MATGRKEKSMSIPYENVKAFVDGMNYDLFHKYAKAVRERQDNENTPKPKQDRSEEPDPQD